MNLFRERKDLVVKVFHGGDEDEPFICAVNGECRVSVLCDIEELLMGEDHEFSSGSGEYTYKAAYDAGQYDEMGRCENLPYWELTEIGFEAPGWMDMTHEPESFVANVEEPCPNCGIVDCHLDSLNGCIPF
ncbi:hypothetical protein QN382_19865 [Pseudomonas sp. 10B1]|uniref:hypothetical protein n=1 Tax=Pseudomonas sp. 10B1 TaxID=3048573 RepID=UPI002B23CDA1|nr:hypothetical protein [Pseudomonas sp. 10B1]MEB0311534.1 hypothetical protein [Pseudomonas sp. 10B1]